MRDPNFWKGQYRRHLALGKWRFWYRIFGWKNGGRAPRMHSGSYQARSQLSNAPTIVAQLARSAEKNDMIWGGYVGKHFEARMATAHEKIFVQSLWGTVRLGADVAAAGHRSSKWTFSGCQSCSVVVRMLWSSISALKRAYDCLPTRPGGRAVDRIRFWIIFCCFLINFQYFLDDAGDHWSPIRRRGNEKHVIL